MKRKQSMKKHLLTTKTISKNENIKKSSRFRESYFTRERKMNFSDVVLFTLISMKNSTQLSLKRCWKTMKRKGQSMSQQAYSKARNHFDHTPFETMFRVNVSDIYSGIYEDLKKWHGRYIFAVDGTYLALPNDPQLKECFGAMGKNATSPMARVSAIYDVLNDVVADACLDKNGSSEARNAKSHIEWLVNMNLADKSILIFDRGYASVDFIKIFPPEMKFVFRMRRSLYKQIDEAKNDSIVELPSGIPVRVIKLMLDSGEEEVLITNLFEVENNCFKKLYFMRWPIETKYDILKNKLELENFSGKTLNTIMQDFWASLVVVNLIADAKAEADDLLQKKHAGKGNKYIYTANVNQLVGALKENLLEYYFSPKKHQKRLWKEFSQDILRSAVPTRTSRSVDRPTTPRKAKFHHNHKSNA